jgi:hypothetical protein
VGGWLLERADGHRIMAAAAGATTVVNIVMAMASSFELVVVMQLCYGLLGGGSEVVINTLTLQCALNTHCCMFLLPYRLFFLRLVHTARSIISERGRYHSATMVLQCHAVVPLRMLHNLRVHSAAQLQNSAVFLPSKKRATMLIASQMA